METFSEKLNKAINNRNINEFDKLVDDALGLNKSWRLGQTMFNVLCAYDPALAEKVRGSPLDPFHTENIEVIGKFKLYLMAHWEVFEPLPEDDK